MLMISRVLAVAFLASATLGVSTAKADTPDDAGCTAALRRAVESAAPGEVPTGCWQVGPIRLAMTEAEVERLIGAPVATTDLTAADLGQVRRYHATLYAFTPGRGALVRGGRVRIRLVELRYDGGRVAAIDNEPGARIDGYACKAKPSDPAASDTVDVSLAAGPLLRFHGVRVGDPVAALPHRFGRPPAGNRPRDWYSYLPVPISFDADPDRASITGFAIATSAEALTSSALPELHLHRDPKTCAIVSVDFGFGRG